MKEPESRHKEWLRKFKEGVGTPESHQKPDGGWQTTVRIAQMIILVNLIIFCAVMAVVDISMWTKPTVVPEGQEPSVFDRAQKYD